MFCGLTAVYVSDFVHSIGIKAGERALGFFHILTGWWLMYLTFATGLNMAAGGNLPLSHHPLPEIRNRT